MQPETRAEAQMRAERLFDRLDVNHDGKLDQADRAAQINELFDRFDTNHDGMLSRAEFAAAHEQMMAGDHDMDGAGPGGGMAGEGRGAMRRWEGGGGGHEHRQAAMMVKRIMDRADPAHSGTVTRAGFVQAALALFDQADTNHDGILSPAERQAAHQAMHGDGPRDMTPPAQ